jgi:hypothetical protein
VIGLFIYIIAGVFTFSGHIFLCKVSFYTVGDFPQWVFVFLYHGHIVLGVSFFFFYLPGANCIQWISLGAMGEFLIVGFRIYYNE